MKNMLLIFIALLFVSVDAYAQAQKQLKPLEFDLDPQNLSTGSDNMVQVVLKNQKPLSYNLLFRDTHHLFVNNKKGDYFALPLTKVKKITYPDGSEEFIRNAPTIADNKLTLPGDERLINLRQEEVELTFITNKFVGDWGLAGIMSVNWSTLFSQKPYLKSVMGFNGYSHAGVGFANGFTMNVGHGLGYRFNQTSEITLDLMFGLGGDEKIKLEIPFGYAHTLSNGFRIKAQITAHEGGAPIIVGISMPFFINNVYSYK